MAMTGFFAALSLYAIMIGDDNQLHAFPTFTASAQAQEISQCTMNAQKKEHIKKSAKGFFQNMRFADDPYNASSLHFNDAKGNPTTLAASNGKTRLVNLWAIWCVPCRTEMPELAQLQTKLGSESFEVLAINIDKVASEEKINAFLKEVKADNLALHRDQTMGIFNQIRRDGLALGLPVTLLIDKDGCLIASFNGAAPWADEDSQTLMRAAIDTEQ